MVCLIRAEAKISRQIGPQGIFQLGMGCWASTVLLSAVTFSDFKGWCQEVGFRRFEVLPLAGPASAAIACK